MKKHLLDATELYFLGVSLALVVWLLADQYFGKKITEAFRFAHYLGTHQCNYVKDSDYATDDYNEPPHYACKTKFGEDIDVTFDTYPRTK